MQEVNGKTTISDVEKVEQYLITIYDSGKHTNCISKAYLVMIQSVLKHIRVRMARGEWSN
jgi:DNA-binding TFAR19-related protein (PDSD5 family)